MSQPPYPPSDQGQGPYPQSPQGGSPPGVNPQGGMPPNQYGQNPYPQNPYPQGPAGQYGSAPPMQRPKEVDTSFYLWIASIVVGLLGAILAFAQSDGAGQQAIDQAVAADPAAESVVTAVIVASLVFALAILALELFFVFKMRAGRNWARITLAVLGGLSVLSSLSSFGTVSGIALVVNVVSLLLLIGAIVMMFVKGAGPWFQQRRAY